MNWVKETLWFALRTLVVRQTAKSLERKGLLFYLKGLQVARLGLAGSLAVFCFLQLMIFGFIGALVSGVLLLPEELNTRLWILFGVFAALFLLPLIGLLILFSERLWFRLSGAEEMMKKSA